MHNLYEQFRQLIPDPPLQAGTVVGVGSGVVTVALPGGGLIRELRDLLDGWRDARRTAWQTTVKVITTGILAALLVGAAIKLKLMGGPQ